MATTSSTPSAPSNLGTTTAAPRHPVVEEFRAKRAADAQAHLADLITKFAGSMAFVYVHIVVFAAWMLVVERSPWPTLTLVVSLEAIFLSTFVMIGQNRAAAFAQAKADHDFREQELELKDNTEITRMIHVLTQELHDRLLARQAGAPESTSGGQESGQDGR